MMVDDPVIYGPMGPLPCSTYIAYMGGWENVGAQDSAELNRLGCYPDFNFPISLDTPDWTVDTGGGGGGATIPAPISESTSGTVDVPSDVSLQTGFELPQEAPMDDFLGLGTIGIPDSPTQISGPSDNFSGYFGSIASIVAPVATTLLGAPSTQGPLDQLLKAMPEWFQKDQFQIDTGITRQQVPGRCKVSRRKLKIVTDRAADGTLHPRVILACPPRRMNPLNARALGRSARRLAAFHRISGHIEKIIQHACRKKGRSHGYRMPASSCRTRKRC